MKQKNTATPCEQSRCRLMSDICELLRQADVPDEAREAGLTLIGWLARRFPEESADPVTIRPCP